jgi:hypothetical protein
MRIKILILFLFCGCSLHNLLAQTSKTVYSLQPKDFKDLKTISITVENDQPFGINFILHEDSGIKKAISYVNDFESQTFTSSEKLREKDFAFSSNELKAITVKVYVAEKRFEKAANLKMVEISYTDNTGTQKKDTLTDSESVKADYFKKLKTEGITSYSVHSFTIPQAIEELKLSDSTADYTIVFVNGNEVIKNSNILLAALIKSLAGARPQDELVDFFLKLNYTREKKWFSLLGADAGIGSNRDTTQSDATGLFRINEAIGNFNYAFYNRKPYKPLKLPDSLVSIHLAGSNLTPAMQKMMFRAEKMKIIDSLKKENVRRFDDLKRTAFTGVGLKIFGSIPYVGAHFGSMEINGPLFASYIFVGYYYAPYKQTVVSKDSLTYTSFHNNIYLEAALNAFGSNVPSVLKTLKIKFGIMFPLKGKDADDSPGTKDIISRLAIEIPFGNPFRF